MNPLIRKEIRLILPFWGIAIFLAIVPALIVPRDSWAPGIGQIIFWAFGFGVLLLGLAPFGQEFSLGTFSSLLAQPFERNRIWKTKSLLILVAMLVVLFVFMLSIYGRLHGGGEVRIDSMNSRFKDIEQLRKNWYAQEYRHSFVTGLLLMLVAITGGFWTSLLFRQTGAALWFAILVPGAIFMVIELLAHGLSQVLDILLFPMLAIYSAFGFFWARRMFLDAQDSQWLGETISLLSLSSSKTRTEATSTRRKSPLAALIRREFQSHQISLLIAFGLLVLHTCSLFFRKFYTLPGNSELRFAVEAIPFLWLLVPWLLGCVAVAEERKLGTMESQLCLPVTRRLQFVVKFAVVLLLGVVLGGLMPCLVEAVGTFAGVSSEIVKPRFLGDSGIFFATVMEVVTGAGAIAAVSFFASSLTRNTLHALGAAIVFGGAFIALYGWVGFESRDYDDTLWKGPLILIAGLPVWIIAVLWLSFSNYKRLHAGRNVWLRNVLILSGTLVFTGIATAVIYQRPWELVVSLEPQHGAARLDGPVRPVIRMPGDRIFALLPDGRLWVAGNYHWMETDRYEQVWDSIGKTNRMRKQKVPIPASGTFVGGSNWITLAISDHSADVIALQADGTLWKILSWSDKTNSFSRNFWFGIVPEPRRIGTDNDWKAVAAGQNCFLAVKTNGTLWGWGGNEDKRLEADLPDHIREPVRIGHDSDWAAIFPGEYDARVMKNNGEIWEWGKIGSGLQVALVRTPLNGSEWLAASGGGGDSQLVIHKDGTLWSLGYRSQRLFGAALPFRNRGVPFQIGEDSDWVQVSGDRGWLVAIKKDGRLVKNGMELFANALGQPSKHSDWLAADNNWNGLVAIAADGTVSQWRDTREGRWDEIIFGPTHRPLWSLNIFSDSDEAQSGN